MMNHGGWESSLDRVTKEGFFSKVLFELSLEIGKSEPSQALEEEYSRSSYMMMKWHQGTGSIP